MLAYSLDWHPADHLSFVENVGKRKLHNSSTVSTSREKNPCKCTLSIFGSPPVRIDKAVVVIVGGGPIGARVEKKAYYTPCDVGIICLPPPPSSSSSFQKAFVPCGWGGREEATTIMHSFEKRRLGGTREGPPWDTT